MIRNFVQIHIISFHLFTLCDFCHTHVSHTHFKLYKYHIMSYTYTNEMHSFKLRQCWMAKIWVKTEYTFILVSFSCSKKIVSSLKLTFFSLTLLVLATSAGIINWLVGKRAAFSNLSISISQVRFNWFCSWKADERAWYWLLPNDWK